MNTEHLPDMKSALQLVWSTVADVRCVKMVRVLHWSEGTRVQGAVAIRPPSDWLHVAESLRVIAETYVGDLTDFMVMLESGPGRIVVYKWSDRRGWYKTSRLPEPGSVAENE